MLAFFFSLFYSIFTGSWTSLNYNVVAQTISDLFNKTCSLIVNALGGKFESIQTFVLVDSTLSGVSIISAVLAIIAVIMVCMLTFKLVKMVFSIFFGGR